MLNLAIALGENSAEEQNRMPDHFVGRTLETAQPSAWSEHWSLRTWGTAEGRRTCMVCGVGKLITHATTESTMPSGEVPKSTQRQSTTMEVEVGDRCVVM